MTFIDSISALRNRILKSSSFTMSGRVLEEQVNLMLLHLAKYDNELTGLKVEVPRQVETFQSLNFEVSFVYLGKHRCT